MHRTDTVNILNLTFLTKTTFLMDKRAKLDLRSTKYLPSLRAEVCKSTSLKMLFISDLINWICSQVGTGLTPTSFQLFSDEFGLAMTSLFWHNVKIVKTTKTFCPKNWCILSWITMWTSSVLWYSDGMYFEEINNPFTFHCKVISISPSCLAKTNKPHLPRLQILISMLTCFAVDKGARPDWIKGKQGFGQI